MCSIYIIQNITGNDNVIIPTSTHSIIIEANSAKCTVSGCIKIGGGFGTLDEVKHFKPVTCSLEDPLPLGMLLLILLHDLKKWPSFRSNGSSQRIITIDDYVGVTKMLWQYPSTKIMKIVWTHEKVNNIEFKLKLLYLRWNISQNLSALELFPQSRKEIMSPYC